MAQRAADYSTAQNVCMAVELARCGAGASLIENLTGFGARWIRGVVLENGGAWARKPRKPLRWLEGNLQRMMHATYIVVAHEGLAPKLAAGKRLLSTYRAYRRLIAPQPALLDINECGQIIELYQNGTAYLRDCGDCHVQYLVLSERSNCPQCRVLAHTFCKGCGVELAPSVGKPRSYCPDCAPRSVRLAIRRRNEQLELQARAKIARSTARVPNGLAPIKARVNQVREPDLIASVCSAFPPS